MKIIHFWKQNLNKKKLYFLIFTGFLFGGLIGLKIPSFLYNLNPTGDKGAWFVKKCADINGKTLNFDNLKTLNGYIGLTFDDFNGSTGGASFGYYPFDEKYFTQYLNGEYDQDNKKVIKNKLVLRIFYDDSFTISEKQELKGNWKCIIKPDSHMLNSNITTRLEFIPNHFFYD